MSVESLPKYDSLLNPVLTALRSLGGSGSIQEVYDKVIEQERLPDEVLSIIHDAEKSTQTEVAYRLAWARTYLKKYGLVENSSRGIWALTSKAAALKQIDPREVKRAVRLQTKNATETEQVLEVVVDRSAADDEWKYQLNQLLTQKIDPAGFERLVQRLLRESGFTQVEVTGRSGDGGIDGRGIARVHGLLSFHVLFQCKRYRGAVGPSEIRDFRGAMVGRSDKGLFITTGTFTPAAVKEATRDGAPAIDLIDGNDLSEKLKELKLGISTATVEVVTIDAAWFDAI